MTQLTAIVTIIGIVLLMCVSAEKLYPDKYDGIDVKGILENNRLREQHVKCYTNSGPCVTEDMKFYKVLIGEAIVTKCKRCTEKQKENLNTLIDWYTTNQPEQWEEILKKVISNLKKENA